MSWRAGMHGSEPVTWRVKRVERGGEAVEVRRRELACRRSCRACAGSASRAAPRRRCRASIDRERQRRSRATACHLTADTIALIAAAVSRPRTSHRNRSAETCLRSGYPRACPSHIAGSAIAAATRPSRVDLAGRDEQHERDDRRPREHAADRRSELVRWQLPRLQREHEWRPVRRHRRVEHAADQPGDDVEPGPDVMQVDPLREERDRHEDRAPERDLERVLVDRRRRSTARAASRRTRRRSSVATARARSPGAGAMPATS